MTAMAGEPHVAGRPGSRKVAEYALEKFKSWGLDARIESFEAMMPWPTERLVEMVGPTRSAMSIKEPVLAEDPDSNDADSTPVFNAYSADGDATGEVVYVNYGMPADYDRLKELGVDVKGKIVLARYGGGWRGIKPKVAYEHGAIGCLIYSDPRDDGYFQGDVYPGGRVPSRAGRAARQRDGHAGASRRSAHAGVGRRTRRQEAGARELGDDPQDSSAADLLRRRAATPEGPEGPGGAGGMAWRPAPDLSRRARARPRPT